MMEVPIISDDKKIEQFGLFDRDNDGKITPTEVHEVLGSFAQSKSHQSATDEDLHHHVQEIIGKHDHDGDGILTHAGTAQINLIDHYGFCLLITSSNIAHEQISRVDFASNFIGTKRHGLNNDHFQILFN